MSHIGTQEYDGLSKYGGTVKTRRCDRTCRLYRGSLKPEMSSMRNPDNIARPTIMVPSLSREDLNQSISRDWGPVYPNWTKLGFSKKEVQTPIPLLSMELTCSKRFLSYCLDSFINKIYMGKKEQQIQKIYKKKTTLQRIFLKIRESIESSKSVRWCRLPWWLVTCWSCIKELEPITPTVVH